MKNIIKRVVEFAMPEGLSVKVRTYRRAPFRFKPLSIAKAMFKIKIVLPPSKRLEEQSDTVSYVKQFEKISNKIDITSSFYLYPYDKYVCRAVNKVQISSITVDAGTVLNSSLDELKNKICHCSLNEFKNVELSVIDSIERILSRCVSLLEKQKSLRSTEQLKYFSKMLYRKPESLDEAIQKILFYNALFWQMGHWHNGLGRLDFILNEYYENDINNNRISKEEGKNMIRYLLLTLGKDTSSKSLVLIGDTGQYILLGGIDDNGKKVENSLTGLFLEVMTELKVPDPKLILRVNKDTSNEIWTKSIKCMLTGIGSPLIMNEKPIMENMVRFGYKEEDVWNIGTSACWEPLVIGKSFCQNNPFPSVVAVKCLNDALLRDRDYESFSEILSEFKNIYRDELKSVVTDLDFDCSPLYTLFFDDCINREKDFARGGAIYAHHGAQVVSLPNTINSLLNLKRLVFDEKLYTIDDCRNAIRRNFDGMDDFRILLTSTGKKFGSTDREVIDLTNDIIKYTGEVIDGITCHGEKVKVGFSSPNYIGQAKNALASLDGRRTGDPFAVHISPISSDIDISEILDFASELRFEGNRINGNVVDFILPPSYLKQPDKLIGILKNACDKGIFELQLNVLDKDTLIDAKAHPEKYPNLVVRVWGFSAYFNDLPEEYKDNLIQRAETYEVD